MTKQIELFNRFRDIQHAPLVARVVNNFDLYRDLFEGITLDGSSKLNSLKANLHFATNDGREFCKIFDDKYFDLWFNLDAVDTETFDDFIFCRKSIESLIKEYCSKLGFNVIEFNITTLFQNAYESWDSYLNRIGYDERNLIASPTTEKMKKALREQNFVWCHNKSCSGKTYTAIELLKKSRKRAIYNPCFQSSCSYESVKILLTMGRNFSLLIDDIQCDIEKAQEIFEYIYNNYLSFPERNLQVFLVSWSSLLTNDEFKKYATRLPCYETNPLDYIELLKHKISEKSLLTVCGDNIALLNAASKVVGGDSDNSRQNLYRIFVHTDDTEKIRQIYRLCVLGIYEYSAPKVFLGMPVITSSDLSTLKITDSVYYAGHREICQFIVTFIEKNELTGCQERSSVIKDYILSIENSKKWKHLKQLVGERNTHDLNAVSPIWNTLNCFEDEIKRQTQKDPSWNSMPSSMYFVLNTASLLGIADEYFNILSSLCSKFIVCDQKPLISLNYEKIATTNDFERIKRKMIDADEGASAIPYEAGVDFDCNQAHKNWVLGLVVGLKKELINGGYSHIYDKAVEELRSCQTTEGYWYPKRIPWVTARIVIGLSQAGYSVSDNYISNAVSYLLTVLDGKNYWEPHTGGWNTVYETSSLCLEAIFRSGYKYNENKDVLRVANYLLSNKDNWMAEGNEIDGSATACSLVKILGIKGDLLTYIIDLCNRCVYNAISCNNTLDANELQSCNTTQIASYTIELCWHIFERDLPNLLEQFIKRSTYNIFETKETTMKSIFISYTEDSPNHIRRVKKISDFLKDRGFIVYFYKDMPLGTNNVEFMQKAEGCDIILVIGTPKYKEKAMKTKAGGVFFEENVLSVLYMTQYYERIIPIAFGDFKDSFPTPFNLNKGMRCPRVDNNFLNNLVEEINKK